MDPLYIANPREVCASCGNRRRRRRRCEECRRTGFAHINLWNSWAPQPGFLVCGGPSLADVPLDELKQRGVMTLGVNNAAAFADCDAMVFGDPQWKFHSSCFFDPKCMVFAPNAKLVRHVRMQDSDTGEFKFSKHRLADCPNVYGICRSGQFHEETFFTDFYCHWGKGGKGDTSERSFTRLATMLIGIRMLHYLGCRTIYMLGVDFWMTKEKPYAWGGNRTSGNRIWWKIDEMMGRLRAMLERSGIEIYNCNPETKSTTFPYCDFECALEHSTIPFGEPPYDLSKWYERKTLEKYQEKYPEPVDDYIT